MLDMLNLHLSNKPVAYVYGSLRFVHCVNKAATVCTEQANAVLGVSRRKALLASFGNDVPNALIEAIVSANDARKRDVVETVLAREPKRIGIYRLAAKTGSDNMRSSAAADIVNRLVARGADVVIYEPLIADEAFRGARVTRSLEELFDTCDIVLANRMDDELLPYRGKVFTRDLFHRD